MLKWRSTVTGALGSAIIAHWTFSIQEKGLLSNTTLLERPLAEMGASFFSIWTPPKKWISVFLLACLSAPRTWGTTLEDGSEG